MHGLVAGMASGYPAVQAAAAWAVTNAVAAANHAGGMKSPSTITMQMGVYLMQGLINGMLSMSSQVATAANQTMVDALNSLLQSVSSVMTSITSITASAASMTTASMQQMVTGINLLSNAAPQIQQALIILGASFAGWASSPATATLLATLTTLDGVLSPLSSALTSLGSASTSAAGITTASIAQLMSALTSLVYFSPAIKAAMGAIAAAFSNVGDTTGVTTNLTSLDSVFQKISSLFTDMGSAATGAANVTPAALSQISIAVQSAIHTVEDILKTAIPAFTSIGLQLMQGLAAGVAAGGVAVVAAAEAVAIAALTATRAATQTASPSKLYAEEGQNWMLGLVQGIKGGAPGVQGALTSSLPHVGRATGVNGGIGPGTTYAPTYQVTINAAGGNSKQISTDFQKMLNQHDADLLRRLKAGTISGG